MVEGTIRSINVAANNAVIVTRDGRELTVQFGPASKVEVHEETSMGMRPGALVDLQVGYVVEVDVHDHRDGGHCHCSSLVSIT